MKKIIISLFLIAFSASVLAQELTCIDKLLPYNRHSGLHQITKDEWNDGKETLDAENALTALTFLTNSKLFCKSHEVTIKVFPVCSTITTDIAQSNTCFIFTNLGYFVASRDGGRNVNFIFSKDKTFADPKPQ
jgi:hypothetical protein